MVLAKSYIAITYLSDPISTLLSRCKKWCYGSMNTLSPHIYIWQGRFYLKYIQCHNAISKVLWLKWLHYHHVYIWQNIFYPKHIQCHNAIIMVLWLKWLHYHHVYIWQNIFYPKYMHCHNAINMVLWLNGYIITTYVTVTEIFITSIYNVIRLSLH